MEEMKVVCITNDYEEFARVAAAQKYPMKYILIQDDDLFGKEYVPQNNYTNKWNVEDTASLLKKLGIPTHIKGYRFLEEAVEFTIKDPMAIDSVTKCIYPQVAKKYSTTASRVERAIRHAIEVAWTKRGEIPFQEEVFKDTLDHDKIKPTNSQFIATLADYIIHN